MISRGYRARRAGAPRPSRSAARREVLHEHVGALQQPEHRLDVARGLEVEGDALLGPVEPHEVARHPVHGLVVAAREVPGAGPLDLDHPRAEVGEVPGGQRGGHRLLASDDGDAVQGERHRIPTTTVLVWV